MNMATRILSLFFLTTATAALALLLPGRAASALQETPAAYVCLMDADSGAVLFEKNGEASMAPASMSKLMTMLLVFDRIQSGDISLEDEIRISVNAWEKGGARSGSSTMFAEPNSLVPLEDLIRGVIVQSANDASIAVAEALSGSEADFAREMNHRAEELGLTASHFVNASGWPHPEHRTTALDLAKLARYILRRQPTHYAYYAEPEFTWNGIRQYNRNPLLTMNLGADGLKTGHTEDSGYGLVASAERDGRRLILVVNGLESEKQRAEESARLMQWGFAAFRSYRLLEGDDVVAEIPVWHGAQGKAALIARRPVEALWTAEQRDNMKVRLAYESPLYAPVDVEAPVARLILEAPGAPSQEIPLWSEAAIPRAGLFSRALDSLEALLFPRIL